jgi:F-type H+-transporting ATPase subunit epsilon
MATQSVTLDILTPHGPIRSDVPVPGVELPGLLGEMGVLPEHEAFITAVKPGVVRFREGDQSTRFAVGAGFLEVTQDGRVVILVERAIEGKDVDVDRVSAELRDVEQSLASATRSITSPEHQVLSQTRDWLAAQLRAADGRTH